MGFDNVSANAKATMATTKPAMGPAIPISNNVARERMGDRMRMNAPNVPMSVGAGIRKGRVAYTPERKQYTKWPISWESKINNKMAEKGIPNSRRDGSCNAHRTGNSVELATPKIWGLDEDTLTNSDH